VFGVEYRFKPVVQDEVVLWADVPSVEISNETDIFSVDRGVSNKLSSTRPRFPFGDFTSGGVEA